MLIECLIRRVGQTTVILGNTKYLFMPIPGTKYHNVKHRNLFTSIQNGIEVKQWVEEMRTEPAEESTSMCEVTNEQHVAHLLASGQYREYNPARAQREADEARMVKPRLTGYSIEKYRDEGYIVARKNSAYPYCGPDAIWRKDRTGTSFKSEIEAYNFLKEEATYGGSEEEQTEEREQREQEAKPEKKEKSK